MNSYAKSISVNLLFKIEYLKFEINFDENVLFLEFSLIKFGNKHFDVILRNKLR